MLIELKEVWRYDLGGAGNDREINPVAVNRVLYGVGATTAFCTGCDQLAM